MKIAEVKKLLFNNTIPDLDEVSAALDELNEKHQISTLNWKGYEYKPEVKFAIAYSDREIYLKYYITEDYFKAEKTEPNQMVCEDSCVEFFVSPEDDGIYYNLEFNGIGTILLGTGTGRADSKRADPSVISKIRRRTSVGNNPVKETKGAFEWTITIAVPVEVFFHHKIDDLKGKIFRANFYKCGDMLSVPHYVTWNPVGTENPDYHQPAYFGMLKFV
ncbi:MAG TPA: carbohydrate-binding family 9-like protein [Bacteroidales bacterium]|nr:carbohydrate-binding family 9-like protein [Bacteroidales bacterium]